MMPFTQAFVFAVVILCGTTHGMMPSGFGRKKETIPAIKSDIKYIKCDVCELVAREAYRSVGSLRKSQPTWKKLTEEAIMEHLEKMCNPQTEQGEWILHLDVEEQRNVLKVVEKSGTGECRRECMTIAKVCDDLLGEHDIDISEAMYKDASSSVITNQLCHELTSACTGKPPIFKGPRPAGEEWKEVDPEELKLKRMLAQLEGDGMSGNIMNRENAMKQMEEYKEQLEEYDVNTAALTQQTADGMFDARAAGSSPGDEL